MLRLLDKTTVVPGGFRFLNRETHHWSTAPSWSELVGTVIKHRRGNNLPIPVDMESLIEDQLCSILPPGACMQDGGYQPKHVRLLSLGEVKTATLTLGEWLLKGMPKVDQEEADRRATICISCPYNQPINGCTSCSMQELRAFVDKIVGSSKTTYDEKVNTCFACGCQLKAAVWLPLDLLTKHKNDEQKQLLQSIPWCWQR